MNNREQSRYIKQASKPINTEKIVERSEKSKQFFHRSITAFRVIGGIVALVLAAVMLGGLIWLIILAVKTIPGLLINL